MSSTTDPDIVPFVRARKTPKGHDVHSLGPSDSSDTGADMTGLGPLDDTSDREHTGERMAVEDDRVRAGRDIDTDRIVDPEDAGLGEWLDEAEEAWLEHDGGEH